MHKPAAAKAKPAASKTTTLKGVDPKLAQIVLDEVLEGGSPIQWDDIAGQEVVIRFDLDDNEA